MLQKPQEGNLDDPGSRMDLEGWGEWFGWFLFEVRNAERTAPLIPVLCKKERTGIKCECGGGIGGEQRSSGQSFIHIILRNLA